MSVPLPGPEARDVTDAALDREMGYTDWRTSCRTPHPDPARDGVVCRRGPHEPGSDHASGFGTSRVRWPSTEFPRPEFPVVPIAVRGA